MNYFPLIFLISAFASILSKRRQLNHSDYVLVQQYLTGDMRTQETLHAFVEDLIESALRSLEAKGSNFRDRQNTKQEIIVSIMVKDNAALLRNFKGESRLSTYLWSVIRFKLIDALRKEMRAADRHAPLPENIIAPSGGASELPELIDRYLEQCSEKDAFILRLRWLAQEDYTTICQEASVKGYEVDKTYIGNLLFRTRKEILSFLKNQGYEIDI